MPVAHAVRIDLVTGSTAESAPMARMSCPVVAFGSTWVAGRTDDGAAPTGPGEVRQLDGASLGRVRTIPLPPSGNYAVAHTTSALWVATTTQLLRIDPTSGAVQARVPLEAGIDSIGALGSVDGDAIYLSEHQDGGTPTVVEQRDPTTGALVAWSIDLPAVGGVDLLYADGDGVWMSYSTGMMGAISELLPGTLDDEATIPGLDGVPLPYTNGLVVVADRTHVIVGSLQETLDCYATATATLQARIDLYATPIAVDETMIVAVTGSASQLADDGPDGLAVVAIPDGC
jgi:hypothetical protein